MKSKERKGFTQRQIAEVLNNAVVKTLRPLSLGEIPEEKLRKLRNYTQALVDPCFEHVQEGLFCAEELVLVLTSAALFVQMSHVMNTDKLPMGHLAEDLMELSE